MGYQPAELRVQLYDLWDHHGVNYKGVLTWETEGAPHTFTFSHSRYTEGYDIRMPSDNHIHKDQLKLQFAHAHKTSYGNCADYACRVFNIPEIPDSKSCKDKGT